MATSIFHGPPGSYKTSTAIWFELLPALRAGRCVVTNIEGMFDLETISKVLGETFPDSASLYRISTLNSTGHALMARWFQWLPVGALIIIDEVQNVYTNKDRTDLKSFDVLDKSLTTVQVIDSLGSLPDGLRSLAVAGVVDIVDDGYKDDMGLSERDSDGNIRYPNNIKDALMRHRKFNWDVIVCTPDITKVHELIRSVAEVAVSHKSFDFIPLPYFQRRPRCHNHNGSEKGIRPAKGDPTKKRKIPLNVFKLYKSSQTGKHNKSGVGDSPLKSPMFILYMGVLLSCVAYFIWFFITDEPSSQSAAPSSSVSSSQASGARSAVSRVAGSQSNTRVNSRNGSNKNGVEVVIPDVLAQRFDEIIVTGIVRKTGKDRFVHVTFEGRRGKSTYSFNSVDLVAMGYTVAVKSSCYVLLTFYDISRPVLCGFDKVFAPVVKKERQSRDVSLFKG